MKRALIAAIVAAILAAPAIACEEHQAPGQEPRGYYKDERGRDCYEASFKGKLYRSCY